MGFAQFRHSAFRILVPVVGLMLVLAASYGAVTHQRYDKANGVPGEILPGHSLGQTFIARYPNLSGIELRVGTYTSSPAPTKATLTLHLRSADQINPQSAIRNPQSDLATATLPAGTPLDENPWYLFSFPPIADSQNKAYYVEVESPDGRRGNALTLFWWQPVAPGVGDPYKDGAAYLDGRPQPGDLSMGLRYSPSPLDAWAQMLRATSASFPPPAMLALLLFGVAGVAWGIVRLPAILRDQERRRRWLARQSLPLVLLIALANGLVYVLAIPPWQGPDEHAHFGYAALLDRYDFDVDRVRRFDSTEYRELADAVNTSMDRNDFTRRVAWHSAPGATADAGRSLLWEAEQPPAYYWLSAAAIRAMRWAGFQVDPTLQPESALRVMRGVSLILSLGVVALAWLAGVLLSPRGRGMWLRVMLPLTVALLPMHAFIASIANNDVLAELVVSALFVTIVALLRRPLGLWGLGMAALSVALVLLSLFTKSSALAASLPLLSLGFFVWVGMLATRGIERWRASRQASERLSENPALRLKSRATENKVALRRLGHSPRRRTLQGVARDYELANSRRAGRVPNFQTVSDKRDALTIPAVMGLLALLLGLAMPILAFTPTETAVGWNLGYWPVERATRVRSESARGGSYVLELARPGANDTIRQTLVPSVYHPALDVTFSGWAQLSPGDVSTPISTTATILVTEGSGQAGTTVATLHAPGIWTPITGTAHISESAEQVTLQLTADSAGRPVQFDDLSVSVAGADGPWNDPIFAGRGLLNPSAELGAVALTPLFNRLLPFDARQTADALANPQPFDKGALWSYYAGEQYRSFWGNFGWVSIPLPGALYTLLSALILLVLAGLGLVGVRRWGRWTAQEWMGVVSLGAVVAAVLLGFARQMMLLADLGITAYPQGRYLFVLIVPIAWLLLVGAWSMWSVGAKGVRRILASLPQRHATEGSIYAIPWGLWLWASTLLIFAAYCLLVLILPYYYG